MNVDRARMILGLALFVSGTTLAGEAPHWTYEGEEGPDNWSRITPEYGACAGKNQSPIDLTGFIEGDLAPIKFTYQPGGSEILNNGHTVQVNYAAGSSIVVDGVQFDLKQFHFHAPSENRINGVSFPLEAHLVHADKDGHLAVVALMFKDGAENKALASIWSALPANAGDKAPLSTPFAVAQLLPRDKDYYRFNGSLTTPPCTEGVRWLVLKSHASASGEQVAAFTKVLGHPNNRPVQPVNARVVIK